MIKGDYKKLSYFAGTLMFGLYALIGIVYFSTINPLIFILSCPFVIYYLLQTSKIKDNKNEGEK